jgi:tRNA-Thr(GGU) m(6)t(6)A37 methyltransferase TsaA
VHERHEVHDVAAVGVVSAARRGVEDDFWGGETACITLDERFGADALAGLDTFSHVEILFVFDRVEPAKIVNGARHPRNNPEWPLTGIFAQRGKNRPNRIGATMCRVVRVEGRKLFVAELDAIDGTPVIDIKPVMQEFLPRGPIVQPEWSRALMSDYWKTK